MWEFPAADCIHKTRLPLMRWPEGKAEKKNPSEWHSTLMSCVISGCYFFIVRIRYRG